MGLINFNQLHKADIIFTTNRDSSISKTIRAATNSICSHTMLVVNDSEIIDATAHGVSVRRWSQAKIDCTLAIVMRRKNLLSGTDQDKVVAAARSFENLPYDTVGAAGSGMYGNQRNRILAGVGCVVFVPACARIAIQISENAKDENADKKFFCSELVSRSFSIAGFPVVRGRATDTTPGGLYVSTDLEYVGHLIEDKPVKSRAISPEEFEKNRRRGYRKDY